MLIKIYLAIISIKAWLSVWRRSPIDAKRLWSELFKKWKENKKEDLSKVFWKQLIIPSYRLKKSISLGRNSPSVYRKFAPLLSEAVKAEETDQQLNQKLPSYLVMRNGAMGDVMMMTPAIRNLYEVHDGNINIDVATYFPKIFDNSPYVRNTLNPKGLSQGVHNYDCVIDLNGVYERCPTEHPVDVYMRFSVGKKNGSRSLDLFPTVSDQDFIKQVIHGINSRYVVVHQFHHAWPNRNISTHIWDKITSEIVDKLKLKVIYVGTGVESYAKVEDGYEDHRNRYSIQQLSLLISQSVGFIGADSGPAHIAATTNVPICGFYTCAHHEVRMPLREHGRFLPLFPELECYGCLARHPMKITTYYCQRGDNACTLDRYFGNVAQKVVSFLSAEMDLLKMH